MHRIDLQNPTFSSLDHELSNGIYSERVGYMYAEMYVLNKTHVRKSEKIIQFDNFSKNRNFDCS